MCARSSMCWRNGSLVWRWVGERDFGGRFAGHGAGQAVLRGAVVGLSGRHDDGGDEYGIVLL